MLNAKSVKPIRRLGGGVVSDACPNVDLALCRLRFGVSPNGTADPVVTAPRGYQPQGDRLALGGTADHRRQAM